MDIGGIGGIVEAGCQMAMVSDAVTVWPSYTLKITQRLVGWLRRANIGVLLFVSNLTKQHESSLTGWLTCDLGTAQDHQLPYTFYKDFVKGRSCHYSSQAFQSLCPCNHKFLHPWIKSSTSWLNPDAGNIWKCSWSQFLWQGLLRRKRKS